MTKDTVHLNNHYISKVNTIAKGCTYKVIKKNKTTCWVQLYEDNIKTDTIYKNVRYSILGLK